MSTIDRFEASERRKTPHRTFLIDTWVNCKRWGLKTIRDRFVLVGTLLWPVVWLVLFAQVFQSVVRIPGFEANSYLNFFVPAMLVLIAQFTAANAGIGLVEDIESGMFEKVLTAPMSRTAIFLGKTLADEFWLVFQVGVALALGLMLGARVEAGVLGMLGLLGVVSLYSFWGVALSTIIALRTRSSKATQIATQLVVFPLFFLSSALMPIKFLPEWLKVFARINPLTYGVDAARAIMLNGWIWSEILPAVGVLVALDVVFGAAAVVSIARATDASAR